MAKLETYIGRFTGGSAAVAVHDWETGEETYLRADESFHPASTFKVQGIMDRLHRAREGLSSLEDRLPITNSFTSIADGSRFSPLESDDAEQTLFLRIGGGESRVELTRLIIVWKALRNLHYDARVCRRSTR